MRLYGLIGYPLGHSFSRTYFTEKFRREKIVDADYQLYTLESIEQLDKLIRMETLLGLNVTIPYKTKVIPLLDSVDAAAAEIGAVNCIRITREGQGFVMRGFNTDAPAFEESLTPLLKPAHGGALILGTGGSSRAVSYVLRKMKRDYLFVSRNPRVGKQIGFADITQNLLHDFPLIVNTTPTGMFPESDTKPPIPYHLLTEDNLMFDLVYNPAETLFLKYGKQRNAITKSGLEMLHLQAEKSWQIWNDPLL